jgi:ketosteroid isomerase-like protein
MAQPDQSPVIVLKQLTTQLRSSLEPYFGESDPSTYVARYAREATAFDPWTNGRKDDAAVKDHLMSLAGTIPPLAYEIVSPRVDLFDDMAILTLNVDLTDPEAGQTFAVWNTTEVHHRVGDGWELVHSHWSFATPPPEEPEA